MIEIKDNDLRWCPRCGGRLENLYKPIVLKEMDKPILPLPEPIGKGCVRCGWSIRTGDKK